MTKYACRDWIRRRWSARRSPGGRAARQGLACGSSAAPRRRLWPAMAAAAAGVVVAAHIPPGLRRAAAASPSPGRPDLVIADFDGPTYGDWRATGNAFVHGPARGDQPPKLNVANRVGAGAASSGIDGDGPTGTLTSPRVQGRARFVAFRIGGGNLERDTCLNLLVDGTVVRTATGWQSDHLSAGQLGRRRVRRPDGPGAGRRRRPAATGATSNVDHVLQTDRPERPPVTPARCTTSRSAPSSTSPPGSGRWTGSTPATRQEGWVNDLNGLIFYDGEYHLFAQRWAKCWLHAVSRTWSTGPSCRRPSGRSPRGRACSRARAWSTTRTRRAWPPTRSGRPWSPSGPAGTTASSASATAWTTAAPGSRTPEPRAGRPRAGPQGVLVRPGQPLGDDAVRRQAVPHLHLAQPARLDRPAPPDRPTATSAPTSSSCPSTATPSETEVGADPGQRQLLGRHVRRDRVQARGRPPAVRPRRLLRHPVAGPTPTRPAATGGGSRRRGCAARSFPDMPFNQQISFPCELSLHTADGKLRVFRTPDPGARNVAARRPRRLGRPAAWTPAPRCRLAPAGRRPVPRPGRGRHPRRCPADGPPPRHPERASRRQRDRGRRGPTARPLAPLRTVEVLLDRASIETFLNDGEASSTRTAFLQGDGVSLTADGAPIQLKSLTVWPLKSALDLPSN